MKWQKKLTASERKHLSEHEIRTLNDVRITRQGQAEMRGTDCRDVCQECRTIALKLGIES